MDKIIVRFFVILIALLLFLGILVGHFYNKSKNLTSKINSLQDSIEVMETSITFIQNNPKADTVEIAGPISFFPKPYIIRDTIFIDSIPITNIDSCSKFYLALYKYSDSILKYRTYNQFFEDNLIKIESKDSVLGTLLKNQITYFIKPILNPTENLIQKYPLSIFGNMGYDISSENVLLGVDIQKNKINIGYLGNAKNQNSIKIGYKIY